MMVLGRNIAMPFEAVIRRPPSASEVDKADYISDLHAKLHFVHEIARQNHNKC